MGYRATGIRIDSGDLAYLSCLARDTFERVAARFRIPWFSNLTIVASNDINEDTIISLNEQGHKIDCFGIGENATVMIVYDEADFFSCRHSLGHLPTPARLGLRLQTCGD